VHNFRCKQSCPITHNSSIGEHTSPLHWPLHFEILWNIDHTYNPSNGTTASQVKAAYDINRI